MRRLINLLLPHHSTYLQPSYSVNSLSFPVPILKYDLYYLICTEATYNEIKSAIPSVPNIEFIRDKDFTWLPIVPKLAMSKVNWSSVLFIELFRIYLDNKLIDIAITAYSEQFEVSKNYNRDFYSKFAKILADSRRLSDKYGKKYTHEEIYSYFSTLNYYIACSFHFHQSSSSFKTLQSINFSKKSLLWTSYKQFLITLIIKKTKPIAQSIDL